MIDQGLAAESGVTGNEPDIKMVVEEIIGLYEPAEFGKKKVVMQAGI
jgi:hypothetical protein